MDYVVEGLLGGGEQVWVYSKRTSITNLNTKADMPIHRDVFEEDLNSFKDYCKKVLYSQKHNWGYFTLEVVFKDRVLLTKTGDPKRYDFLSLLNSPNVQDYLSIRCEFREHVSSTQTS